MPWFSEFAATALATLAFAPDLVAAAPSGDPECQARDFPSNSNRFAPPPGWKITDPIWKYTGTRNEYEVTEKWGGEGVWAVVGNGTGDDDAATDGDGNFDELTLALMEGRLLEADFDKRADLAFLTTEEPMEPDMEEENQGGAYEGSKDSAYEDSKGSAYEEDKDAAYGEDEDSAYEQDEDSEEESKGPANGSKDPPKGEEDPAKGDKGPPKGNPVPPKENKGPPKGNEGPPNSNVGPPKGNEEPPKGGSNPAKGSDSSTNTPGNKTGADSAGDASNASPPHRPLTDPPTGNRTPVKGQCCRPTWDCYYHMRWFMQMHEARYFPADMTSRFYAWQRYKLALQKNDCCRLQMQSTCSLSIDGPLDWRWPPECSNPLENCLESKGGVCT